MIGHMPGFNSSLAARSNIERTYLGLRSSIKGRLDYVPVTSAISPGQEAPYQDPQLPLIFPKVHLELPLSNTSALLSVRSGLILPWWNITKRLMDRDIGIK